MPNHLDQVTSAAPKNEEIAAVRVMPENFLDLQRQAGPGLAHIEWPAANHTRVPTGARRDHRPSTASTRRNASAST